MRVFVLVSLILAVISGCSLLDRGKSDSRYTLKHDIAPDNPPDVSNVPDAVPVALPYSRGGNRSTYEVWGKRYAVLDSHVGYAEEGTASWYGLKFHGHKTANGEIYDIYKMSAAHKSLPIPSFARVTNLENGRQVVVRVNDRGPFHGDRLIDLSYAAASRLGMLSRGTARVRVEAIDVGAPLAPASRATQIASAVGTGSNYVQVGSFGNPDNARAAQRRLSQLLSTGVEVVEVESAGRRLHRVLVGPLSVGASVDGLLERIIAAGYSSPMLVNSP